MTAQPDGRAIVAALGGRWKGKGGMCRCPAHEDSSPSLHVTQAPETVLIRCHAGCHWRDVMDALIFRGLWPDREDRGSPNAPMAPAARRPSVEIPDDDELRRRDIARGIWSKSTPIYGTDAETYLRWRAIDQIWPPTLRFAPALRHPEGQRPWPALVGAIQDAGGRICAVQRIFLNPGGAGKPEGITRKMTLGPMRDGAVRLGRVGRVLGIAEGIETAMSCRQIYSLPVWAACGAARMHQLHIPDEVEHLIIFGDPGAPGEAAALRCQQAYRGLVDAVDVEMPPPDIGDWNDHLQIKTGRRAS